MKTAGKFFIAVIFTISLSFSCLAVIDYEKDGLYISSIDRILRLDDSQIDLATAVLLASRDWDGNINYRKYRTVIDGMAEEILQKATKDNSQPSGITLVKGINDYLFNQMNFKAVSDANNPQDLFIHSVIENRQGYCLSLSVLYLSIGERLGLPLYGVVVPGHFFVRYDDGHVKFNIETTSNGNLAEDEHYIKTFKVPTNGYDNLYMKELTKKQTIGCFFNNLGNCYQSVEDMEKAKKIFQEAIELTPTLTEALNNLGNIYKGRKIIPRL